MTELIGPDYDSAPRVTYERKIHGCVASVKVKKVRTPKRAPPRRSPRRAARTAPGFFNETALTRCAHKMKYTVKPIGKCKKKEKKAPKTWKKLVRKEDRKAQIGEEVSCG